MDCTIGIDIGGSTTKIVGFRENRLAGCLMVKAGDPMTSAYGAFGKFLSDNDMSLGDIRSVHCTGVGTSFLKDSIYGIEIQKIDEFIAIGLGGRYISGVDDAVVVSMGTGTAVVSVRDGDIRHVGGTGMGGGTILGLSEQILNIRSIDQIQELAETGDITKVDLLIGDITKSQMSNMKDNTTASNFGKLDAGASKNDLARGILNLVFQSIGTFSYMAARACETGNIILTGNLSCIPMLREIMTDLERLYSVRFIIPRHSDFATAIGAAVSEK